MLSDGVVYGLFYGFFRFCRHRKNEKRGREGEGGGVMAGDAGAELEPGRGTAGELARIGGGMAAAWLEVCRRCSWRLLWFW